jgi:MFS family permease
VEEREILEERRLPSAMRALRHRNFRLFLFGQLFSLVGLWMQDVAQSWLVYRLTHSPLLLGLIGFAGQFPVFVLGLVGGVVADRFNRHRVMTLTQSLAMTQALILAFLTLGGWITVGEIFLLALFMGVVRAFDMPTRQSFVVEMVGREDLLSAIALNSSLFNSARIVGPAIAGILVASVGEGPCFLVNGLSYIAVLFGLLAMRVDPRATALSPASTMTHIREGLTYAFHTPSIRVLLLLIGGVSLLGMPYVVLMPVFAEKILHSGAQGFGLLMGASGVGAILGVLYLAWRGEAQGLGRAIPFAMARFGVGLILFSLSRSLWLSLLLLPIVGSGIMVHMTATNTLMQTLVPDHLRGRVMSLYSITFMGMAPLGSLMAGLLAHHLGVPATVALSGLICLVAASSFRFWLPHLQEKSNR